VPLSTLRGRIWFDLPRLPSSSVACPQCGLVREFLGRSIEDALVRNQPGKSDLDVELALGRSLRAVKRRKHYLVHGN